MRNFTEVGEGLVTDSHFTERKKVLDSPMAIFKNLNIDGKLVLELAPKIEDIPVETSYESDSRVLV